MLLSLQSQRRGSEALLGKPLAQWLTHGVLTGVLMLDDNVGCWELRGNENLQGCWAAPQEAFADAFNPCLPNSGFPRTQPGPGASAPGCAPLFAPTLSDPPLLELLKMYIFILECFLPLPKSS